MEDVINFSEAITPDSPPQSEPVETSIPAPEAASQEGDTAGDTAATGSTEQTAQTAQTPGPVPYDRFQEVNSQLAELRQWQPVIEQLRGQGFQNYEAVQQALTQQQEAAYQAQIAQQLQQQIETGGLDPVAAEAQYQMALQQRQLQQTLSRLQRYETDQQIQQVRSQFPEMDETYVRTLHQSGAGSITDLARQSHENRQAYREKVLADYNAAKGAAPRAPEGTGGVPASAGAGPTMDTIEQWTAQQLQKFSEVYG